MSAAKSGNGSPVPNTIPDFTSFNPGYNRSALSNRKFEAITPVPLANVLGRSLLRSYLQGIFVIALRSSWRAANGLGGGALGGVAMIWPGRLEIISVAGLWSQGANWLLSFVLYAIIAWIALFVFNLAFVAPFQLWKVERAQNALQAAKASDRSGREQQIIEHDKKLASQFRSIFPEVQKQKLTADLLAQHAYWSTQGNSLAEVIRFLDSADAHFLNIELQKHVKHFADMSAELLRFMAYKFFVYPKEQTKEPLMFAMQPGLNVDREGDGSLEQDTKYTELESKLDGHVQKMSDSYDELIRAFHVHLLV
jgi:hypothetical protein